MKVVILNPSFGNDFVRVARWSAKSRGRVQRHPEYLLTAAQVLLDAGHDTHFVEAAARNFTEEESIETTVNLKPELLLMHVTTPSIYADIEQARTIKERSKCRVVFVGQHATAEKRIQEYREDVLSHNVPCGNLRNRLEVQQLLQKLGTIPIGQALKIGFLKSLMRARYAVEPIGHYGLAKKKYTHFTSPIRRYADLVVHRALFQSSHGPTHSLKQTADHISDTERNSADAERDSKDVKLFAFLKAQLASGQPQRYAALVTDVRNMGFFVDVPELSMSGLVPLSTMEDDFYVFEPARNHLIGRRTRRIIRLGDKVEVQIANVNSFKKQVDFRLTRTGRERPALAPRGRVNQQRSDNRRPGLAPRSRAPAPRPSGDQRKPIPSSHRQADGRRPQRKPGPRSGRG